MLYFRVKLRKEYLQLQTMMEIQNKALCAERVIVERMNFAVVAVVVEQRTVLRRGKNH